MGGFAGASVGGWKGDEDDAAHQEDECRNGVEAALERAESLSLEVAQIEDDSEENRDSGTAERYSVVDGVGVFGTSFVLGSSSSSSSISPAVSMSAAVLDAMPVPAALERLLLEAFKFLVDNLPLKLAVDNRLMEDIMMDLFPFTALPSRPASAPPFSPSLVAVGFEFSIFSSFRLACSEAVVTRSAARRTRWKVAPTPAATVAEFGAMVLF